MRLLLVYPTTMTGGLPDKFRQAYLPPLNLAILDRLTELADPKHEVKIINEFVEDIDFDADFDLVGITALTSQSVRAYQIADKFRSAGKKVIMGGIHPSLLPNEALAHADAVAVGEVENLWADILSDFETGRAKRIYKDSEFPSLDRLIIPKWDNMDLSVYRRSFGRKMPRMPIYTTRGCVFDCDFCSVSKFFGRTYRSKPIAHVLEEIEATNAESYFFTDDNIICKPEYSQSLFEAMATSIKRKIRWFSQASTNLVDRPYLIGLAAKAGCRSLFFGVESISKSNLRTVNKKINDPLKYVELYRRCSEAGIQPWYSMIFGFDNDTVDSMWETIQFLKHNHIWNVVFWLLTPLPGTGLYEQMVESGRITDTDWARYDLNHVVFQPIHLTTQELYDQFWKVYRAMYAPSSLCHRTFCALKTSGFKGMLNSILNQYYSMLQISKLNHPFSMGLFKYGK